MYITMERIAPTLPHLSHTQRSFLALHTQPVYCHRWHFAGTQLRATGEGGSATISQGELDALVLAGLLKRGAGFDVCLTEPGRAMLEMCQ